MHNDLIIPILAGTLLFLLLASFIIAFWMIHHRRKNALIQEREQLKSRFEQEKLRIQLEIREQTMQHISQEIHDNIGQVLSLVKLQLNTMQLAPAEDISSKLLNSKELLSKAIQDLRDLSKSLSTDFISRQGLQEAVAYELDQLRRVGFYDISLQSTGEPYRMDPEKELILFKVFQEAVNNIIKHAAADTIQVLLSYHPGKFLLQIEDNGKGFDLNNIKSGLGLNNMRSRTSLIGGSLDITNSTNTGTVITILVPQYLSNTASHANQN